MAKMLPAVAAHAIAHYTRPGDLVLDPMCGIGTTLVEALHAGRRAVGVEYEPHWVRIARANLDLAGRSVQAHDVVVGEPVDAELGEHRGQVVGGHDAGHSQRGQVGAEPVEFGGDGGWAAAGGRRAGSGGRS